jgi:hypothetical protein
MYAVVVTVSIDMRRIEDARANLSAVVVPRAKQAPGAKAGYWLEATDAGAGMSMIVFDTREQAEAMAAMIPEEPGPGVTRAGIEVREVVAGF